MIKVELFSRNAEALLPLLKQQDSYPTSRALFSPGGNPWTV